MQKPIDCKIALITADPSIYKEEFSLGEQFAAKYGADRIVHVTCSVNFINEQQEILDSFVKLAQDSEVKILIFSQARPGSNLVVDKLKEIRDDIFIAYNFIHEPVSESVKRANLLLRTNETGMGPAMVKQAKKQGAKAFVHYSFPRHMAQSALSARRDLISQTCQAEGIQFVDTEVPDPTVAAIDDARRFIFDDVSKMTAKYGEDTAFFCSNCHLQAALIKAVVDSHAIFPQPCCPSPSHGFMEALGIEGSSDDLNHIIIEASRIAEEKNMSDRLSTWPVSASWMFSHAGAEYGLKWHRGEVPKTGIDNEALKQCMNAYIREAVGEDGYVLLSPYIEDGISYDNFKCVLMGYLDF